MVILTKTKKIRITVMNSYNYLKYISMKTKGKITKKIIKNNGRQRSTTKLDNYSIE